MTEYAVYALNVATYQFARMEPLGITQPFDVPRDGLAEEPQHLPHGERDAHTLWTVGVTGDQTPQRPKCDDGLLVQSPGPETRRVPGHPNPSACIWQVDYGGALTTDIEARTPMFSKSACIARPDKSNGTGRSNGYDIHLI